MKVQILQPSELSGKTIQRVHNWRCDRGAFLFIDFTDGTFATFENDHDEEDNRGPRMSHERLVPNIWWARTYLDKDLISLAEAEPLLAQKARADAEMKIMHERDERDMLAKLVAKYGL